MKKGYRKVRWIIFIDELFVFIWNGSRAEAQQGYNDDLTISFSPSLFISDRKA